MCCLAQGVAPACRHDGTAFSPQDELFRLQPGAPLGCRAALLQARGDWEWLCQCFRFRHFSSEMMCFLCDASWTGPMSFFNVSDHAPHKATLLTHEQYLAQCAQDRATPSALFSSPGFRLDFVALDSMHCGDLGVFQDAIGSILWLEISNKQWHSSYAAGLLFLNKELERFYRLNPGKTQLRLVLNMVKPADGGWPTLKSKAAECRHLTDFVYIIAQRHKRRQYTFDDPRLHPYSAQYQATVVDVMESLRGYHGSCAEANFDAAACRRHMHKFISSYSELRLLFRRNLPEGLHYAQPFNFRPKAHMLLHIVDQKIDIWGSPREFWCYADEDFVGLVKRICLMTRHPANLENNVLIKYRLFAALCCLELERSEREW